MRGNGKAGPGFRFAHPGYACCSGQFWKRSMTSLRVFVAVATNIANCSAFATEPRLILIDESPRGHVKSPF
jgi:hypothetical protein